MRFSISLIFIFLLLFSCQSDFERMEGHWHLFNTIPNKTILGEGEYLTLDVITDSTALLSNLEAHIDTKEKRIFAGLECLGTGFKYLLKGDKLFLSDDIYGDYIGEKCELKCCDKQKDYFIMEPVNIDLPIISDTLVLSNKHPKTSLQNLFHFGIPKPFYQSLFGDTTVLAIGDKIIPSNQNLEIEVTLALERHMIKLPEHWHSRILPTIFADKNTPISKFQLLFEILQNIGYQRICFAVQKPKSNNFEFETGWRYFKIDSLKFEEGINFDTWINQY